MSSNSHGDIALSVRGLSKSYRIAQNGGVRHSTIREAMIDKMRSPLARPETEEFWAIKDVDFDINRGDVVGIIGRNGAGKSTLLKVLSRITKPTSGEARVYGRVGSLLEVGTGFHPELTGRENIYLNGAILGMPRSEINRQFDAIVDFSGVEKFLDTPVKRYSSGMYVRLAFAVAAHLSTEILIIDEVLAVGDAEFQKKCLGKMQDVAEDGRTVLIVSHNMAVVSSLCQTAIYLKQGKVARIGAVDAVVNDYLSLLFSDQDIDIAQLRQSGAGLGRDVRFSDIRLTAAEEGGVRFNEPLDFEFDVSADTDLSGLSVAGSIFSTNGGCVGTLFNQDTFDIRAGEHKRLRLRIPNTNLAPGMYYAGFSLGVGGMETSRRDYDVVIGKPAFEALALSSSQKAPSLAEWNSAWGSIVFQQSELAEVLP